MHLEMSCNRMNFMSNILLSQFVNLFGSIAVSFYTDCYSVFFLLFGPNHLIVMPRHSNGASE